MKILKIRNFWSMFRNRQRCEFWDSGRFWDKMMVLALSDAKFRRFRHPDQNLPFFKFFIKTCLMHHKVGCYRQESSFNTSGRFCGCLPAYRDLAAGSSFWASQSEYSGFWGKMKENQWENTRNRSENIPTHPKPLEINLESLQNAYGTNWERFRAFLEHFGLAAILWISSRVNKRVLICRSSNFAVFGWMWCCFRW